MQPRSGRAAAVFAFCVTLCSSTGAELQPPGHLPEPRGVHFLRGAKIVTSPGQVIDGGSILIRDGKIAEVGSGLEAPDDARTWDLDGKTIYAGFVDPYLTLKPATNVLGFQTFDTAHESKASGYNFFGVTGQEKDPGADGPGYHWSQVTPERRMAENYSPDEKSLAELRELGFTAGILAPTRGVVRGTSAFITLANGNPNQTILDADVFQHVGFEVTSGRDDAFPRSLMGAIAAVRQAFFDAQWFGNNPERMREVNPSLQALLPASRGEMKVVFEPGSVLMADRAGHLADELGLEILIVASGQEWRRPDLMKATHAAFIVPLQFPQAPKLPEEDDWTQVSLDQLRNWDWAPENAAVLRRQGLEIALTPYGLADRKAFRKNLKLALDRGLSEEDALAALTTVPSQMAGMDELTGTIEQGKLANLIVVEGNYFEPASKVLDVWIEGRIYRVQPASTKTNPETAKKEEAEKKSTERIARSPQEGRGPLASPEAVLVRNATIWTSGPSGVIEGGDLLVRNGKVDQIGTNLTAPEGALVIDGTGEHITPGLIDCHSHAMIVGNVNEATLPSTAMVRIGDVVNSETGRIMEQLAGGLTVANLLHGSANPIGGQNCVIKLKDGAAPEELKLKSAPPGIKFALGENVKQANWGENRTTRFPQTRMGVPVFMENRFTAARQYAREWEQFREGEGQRPRRNLELETLAEILEGKRLVHCHSYRQDEILVFLRAMERFGIQVATLQHVLEGYKVADEIARHGAGASAFSDWWAYKYEVIDAIPYAGAVMHGRGVLVSFNSDSSDLARRMYSEAAKAVKYGGVPEGEALDFVTINPAKQLRIDDRVGSLEPGKDGDFVLWSASPVDSRTKCLQTWIEGKKYFDIESVPEQTRHLRAEREALLAKIKKAAQPAKGEKSNAESEAAFFHLPFELQGEEEDRHCEH